MRYKITIEYLGTDFCGWQRQKNIHGTLSVQEVIEKAIKDFSREDVTIYGSGRTDAGVHAYGQVAHFDLVNKSYKTEEVINAINHFVKPHKISVISCNTESTDFHARFSAKKRYYRYKIINRTTPLSIYSNTHLWVRNNLNIDAILEGALHLVGTHDFTSFRSSVCQANSPIKTVDYIKVYKQDYNEINLEIRARSFLHHMVRNIVGTLILVGHEKYSPKNIKFVLEQRDRTKAGPTAPSHGLYFVKVDY